MRSSIILFDLCSERVSKPPSGCTITWYGFTPIRAFSAADTSAVTSSSVFVYLLPKVSANLSSTSEIATAAFKISMCFYISKAGIKLFHVPFPHSKQSKLTNLIYSIWHLLFSLSSLQKEFFSYCYDFSLPFPWQDNPKNIILRIV